MNIQFFSIPEKEKKFYINAVNSISSNYYAGVSRVEIYDRKKVGFSSEGLYVPYAAIIRISTMPESFVIVLKHELTHHLLFKKYGKMTSDNQNHGPEFWKNLILSEGKTMEIEKCTIELNNKIAGCYDDIEHCVMSQMAMGKKLESATNVCMFLNGKTELWTGNLIFLTPEMKISALPLNQQIAWKAILTLWEKDNKSPEWTLEQIRGKLNELNKAP